MRLKKSILMLALCLIFIIAFSHLVTKKMDQRTKKEETTTEETTETTTEQLPPLDDEQFADTSDSIKVALHTTGFQSLYHKKVTLLCTSDYKIITGKKKIEKKAGESTTFQNLSKETKIQLKDSKGRITITSIKRNQGVPDYRGELLLYPEKEGIVIVNKLSMEEYLYGVVPSEMPASYGSEALKLQAVCARSYAIQQKNKKSYKAYHADVVDSTACQVYNNTLEDGRANQAVRDTKGQILMNGDEIATAYFFSTSCGYTTNSTDVWYETRKDRCPDYLTGHFQGAEELVLNLKKEKDFKTFIDEPDIYNTFERNDNWYRWIVTVSKTDVIKAIKQVLPDSDIGTLQKIEITERGVGGVAKVCRLTGKKGVAVIEKEYNIRKALAVKGSEAVGQNGNTMKITTLLPSGYFYAEIKGKQVIFHGGGFGHGVGMSQTGALRMGQKGYTWEKMAKHYYSGVTLKTCY